MPKIDAKKGQMPDIPDHLKGLYDKERMLILLKNRSLTRKELISATQRNRFHEEYFVHKNTAYKWIRILISEGLILEHKEKGKNTVLTLTEKGEWIIDAKTVNELNKRLYSKILMH